jgi:hypothetical protein
VIFLFYLFGGAEGEDWFGFIFIYVGVMTAKIGQIPHPSFQTVAA